MTSAEELILQSIKDKSLLKLNLSERMTHSFEEFKATAKEFVLNLKQKVAEIDKRLEIVYIEKSSYSFYIRTGSEIIIFEMNPSIYLFDSSHKVWNLPYIQEDSGRAYCGQISIYNFLADTLKFKRELDIGYLIGRIFINKESHFFIEGKRQMGFLYNNFSGDVMTPEKKKEIIESAVLFCLNFDLLIPPYDAVQEATFSQISESAQIVNAATGKRLGFRFSKDEDILS